MFWEAITTSQGLFSKSAFPNFEKKLLVIYSISCWELALYRKGLKKYVQATKEPIQASTEVWKAFFSLEEATNKLVTLVSHFAR